MDPKPVPRRLSRWWGAGLLLGGLAIGLGLGSLLFGLGLPLSPSAPDGAPLFTLLPTSAYAGSAPAPVADALAPDFTLPSLGGEPVSLSQFGGQPVLLNFWATWCGPCRLEMPDLVRAYETHKQDGFVLLGINQTFQDSLSDVQPFVDEFRMTFPVLLDEKGAVADLYRLRGLPLSIFVRRDGVISRAHLGALTATQLEEYLGDIMQ